MPVCGAIATWSSILPNSEVKWSEVKWSEVKWSEVKWRSEVKQEQKREDTCGFLEFFREGKKKPFGWT